MQRTVPKSIDDVDSPAAILDVSILKRNCNRMLDSVKGLDVEFRAHVKTHKVRWPDVSVVNVSVINLTLI